MSAQERRVSGEASRQAGARMELGELLRRLSSDLQEVGREFGQRHDMNHSDVRALILVMDAQRRGEQIGPSALADDLGLSGASVTALVDRLESVGHLQRRPDETDGRRLALTVGPDAARLGGEYFGGLQRRIDSAISDFSDEELAVVSRYLHAAISAVEEHVADRG